MLVTAEAQPERQQSPARQSAQHTHGHLFPQTPTTAQKTLPANPGTWSHAQSGLATFTFHFCAISSRDESIRAAQCSKWVAGAISASQTGLFISNPSSRFKLIHILKWWRAWMESACHLLRSATYSEGERQLPIGLAGWVQVDVLPLPALVIRALALREERRDTDPGVRERRGAQSGC